jgi:hypothetical protein
MISKGYNPNFDICLQAGQNGERWVEYLGNKDATIEVKTELEMWAKTGNIVFEYECRGKPSCIAVTKATTWIHLLQLDGKIVGGFIFDVQRLKRFLRGAFSQNKPNYMRMVVGGDSGSNTKMILVKISELHNIHKA